MPKPTPYRTPVRALAALVSEVRRAGPRFKLACVLAMFAGLCTTDLGTPTSVHAATTGGSGEFRLRIRTCDRWKAETSDAVDVTIQAQGESHRWRLNNGNDRRRGEWDHHYFDWPSSIGTPEQLESIKIHKHGSDEWCLDSVILDWDGKVFWQWRSWDQDQVQPNVFRYPAPGPLWLDSNKTSRHPFIRFTDVKTSMYRQDSGSFGTWMDVRTSWSANAETDRPVEIRLTHDGVTDHIVIPAGALSRRGGTYTSQVGLDNLFIGRITKVEVALLGSGTWRLADLRIYQLFEGTPSSQTIFRHNRLHWVGTERITLAEGEWDSPEFCKGAFGCLFAHEGFPLKRNARWKADIARCASGAVDNDCDGVDDDCDGTPDDDFVGQTSSCGVGDCRRTSTTYCDNGSVRGQCTPGAPTSDLNCDGRDQDCDGTADDGYPQVAHQVSCGVGACARETTAWCADGTVVESCTPGAPSEETCNGIDDDCDGVVDQPGTCILDCTEDSDCLAGHVCAAGAARRFDLNSTESQTACLNPICMQSDPSLTACGTADDVCGFCPRRTLEDGVPKTEYGPLPVGFDPSDLCSVTDACEDQCTAEDGVLACSGLRGAIDYVDAEHIDRIRDRNDRIALSHGDEIGALGGNASVSDHGTLSYSIPIRVPPGRQGFAPGLSLAYDSSAGNGELGVGWRMFGGSAIAQCTASQAQTGEANADEGHYCLDGTLLLPRRDLSSPNGLSYYPEGDPGTRVRRLSNGGWQVQDGRGGEREYGGDDHPYHHLGKKVYALRESKDSSGNTIHYRYMAPGIDETSLVLKWIGYNTRDAEASSATSEITFDYLEYSPACPRECGVAFGAMHDCDIELCGRQDRLQGFAGGRLEKNRLLQRINIRSFGQTAMRYKLHYGTHENRLSRLDSVQYCAVGEGDEERCMQPTTFEYTPFEEGFEDPVALTDAPEALDEAVILDWEGDGTTELYLDGRLYRMEMDPGPKLTQVAALPEIAGTDNLIQECNSAREGACVDYGNASTHDCVAMEVWRCQYDYWVLGGAQEQFDHDRDGVENDRDEDCYSNPFGVSQALEDYHFTCAVQNVPDCTSEQFYDSCRAKGDTAQRDCEEDVGCYEEGFPIDIDGDGATELLRWVRWWGTPSWDAPAKVMGHNQPTLDLQARNEGSQTWYDIAGPTSWFWNDFNGDGLPDFAFSPNDIKLNQGNGRFVQTRAPAPEGTVSDARRRLPAARGQSSFLATSNNSAQALVYEPDEGFVWRDYLGISPDALSGRLISGDFNGDGRTDQIVKLNGVQNLLLGDYGRFDTAGKLDPTPYLASLHRHELPEDWASARVLDVDHDGRDDLVYTWPAEGTGQQVWVRYGRDTLAKAYRFDDVGPHESWVTADFDGDGRLDILKTGDGGQILRGRAPQSGLLTKVSVGIAPGSPPIVTEVQYATGTAPNVYAPSDTACPSGMKCLAVVPHPVVEQVTRFVARNDAERVTVANGVRSTFTYGDARQDPKGRGFVGFGQSATYHYSMEGQLLSVEDKTFDLSPFEYALDGCDGADNDNDGQVDENCEQSLSHAFPFADIPATTTVTRFFGANEFTDLTKATSLLESTRSELSPEVMFSANGLPFTRTTLQTTSTTHGGGATTSTQLAQSTYDAYGNMRTQNTSWPGFSDRVDNTELEYTWEHDGRHIGRWLVALPYSRTTSSSANVRFPATLDSLEIDTRNHTVQRTQRFDYDAAGRVNEIVHNEGKLEERKTFLEPRDSHGNVRQITEVATNPGLDSGPARITKFEYDPLGIFVEGVLNPEGHVSAFGWDYLHGVIATSIEDSDWTVNEHDAFGRLTSSMSMATGVTTTHRLRAQLPVGPSLPLSWNEQQDLPVDAAYASHTTTTGSDGSVLANSYRLHSANGSVVQTATRGFEGGQWVLTETEYDTLGRPVRASRPHLPGDASQGYSENEYDLGGRVIRHVAPDNTATRYAYGSRETSNAFIQEKVLPPGTSATTFAATIPESGTEDERVFVAYDALGQTHHVLEDGASVETRFHYGPAGSLNSIVDPVGNESLSVPDDYGRLAISRRPGTPATVLGYNAFDETIGAVQGTVGRTYRLDRLGRVTEYTSVGTNTETTVYHYDRHPEDDGSDAYIRYRRDGALVQSVSPNGHSQTWSYGGPAKAIDAIIHKVVSTPSVDLDADRTLTTQFEYDTHGRLHAVGYPGTGMAARYWYNDNGYLHKVTGAFEQDEFWRVDKVYSGYAVQSTTLGNGTQNERTFEPLTGRLQELETTLGAETVYREQLTYDYRGSVKTWRRFNDPTQEAADEFHYDALHRLESVTANLSSGQTQLASYTYDSLGNRKTASGVGTYLYGDDDPSTPEDVPQAAPHSLMKIEGTGGTVSLTYGTNGAVRTRVGPEGVANTQGRAQQFEYSNDRNLVRAHPMLAGTGPDVRFSHFADGTRAIRAEADGGTELSVGKLYELSNPQVPSVSGTKEVFRIFAAGQAVAEIHRTADPEAPAGVREERIYLHGNHQGSIVGVTSGDGTPQVLERPRYGLFGELLEAPTRTSLGYTGHRTDRQLGLIDMVGRVFDPSTGRFLQPDPMEFAGSPSQTANRFSYVLNNPATYWDPLGFKPDCNPATSACEDTKEPPFVIINVGPKWTDGKETRCNNTMGGTFRPRGNMFGGWGCYGAWGTSLVKPTNPGPEPDATASMPNAPRYAAALGGAAASPGGGDGTDLHPDRRTPGSGNGSGEDDGWFGTVTTVLEVASYLPGPIGMIASIGNAGIAAASGNMMGAGLELAGVIPGGKVLAAAVKLGQVAKAAKTASRGLGRLPFWRKGQPTRGVLDTGQAKFELWSGNAGGPPALPFPGRNNTNFFHVEAHAAQTMRTEGVSRATLRINRVPCKVKPGCANNLPNMLPEGARLRVRGPNGYDKTFVGLPDPPTYPR